MFLPALSLLKAEPLEMDEWGMLLACPLGSRDCRLGEKLGSDRLGML